MLDKYFAFIHEKTMDTQMAKRPRFSSFLIPFKGAFYFLGSPSLWWRALAWTCVSFLALGALFFTVLLWLWPKSDGSSLQYWIGGGESIGYSLLVAVVFWLFVMPIPTAVFYERMLKKVIKDHGEKTTEERFLPSLTSSLKVIKGTLFQRIFWALFPLLFLFVFAPLFTFFSFVGMGYITLIDAVDLSLTLEGIEGKERLRFLKENRLSLLAGGLFSGLLMGLFLFTLVGFIFLIPSLYVGALLWVSRFD